VEDAVDSLGGWPQAGRITEIANHGFGGASLTGFRGLVVVADEGANVYSALHQFREYQACEFAGRTYHENFHRVTSEQLDCCALFFGLDAVAAWVAFYPTRFVARCDCSELFLMPHWRWRAESLCNLNAESILKLGCEMTRDLQPGEKPLVWIGPSLKDLKNLPDEVQRNIGLALGTAQYGGKHPAAKPWKGEGPGILEVVEDYAGDTFRAIYTVRFAKAIYVLHVFQKKSSKGIATRHSDVVLIGERLKLAQRDYEIREEVRSEKTRRL
jgi:phage-related protein